MKLLSILAWLTLTAGSGLAEPMRISPKHFQSESFKQAFVGSYAFLPKVEPKVGPEENAILAELTPYFDKGQFKAAEAKLAGYLRQARRPGANGEKARGVSPALILVLGNLYMQNGRTSEAERSYRLAIKSFPSFRRAHKNLGRLLADQERYKEALPHLQKAIELGAADSLGYGLLGFIYLNDDDPVSAEIAYRQALLMDPEEKDWKFGLVQALMVQEKWATAAALLETLIRQDSRNQTLWRQQATVYLSMDRRLDAAKNYEILRRMGALSGKELNLLGNLYLDQEEPFLALGAYLEALNQSEVTDVNQSLEAARIMVDFGAAAKAEQLLAALGERELSKEQRIDLLLVRSRTAREAGKEEQVEQHLQEILERNPGNGEALIEYGQLLERRASEAEGEAERDLLFSDAAAKFRSALSIPEVAYDANLKYGQMQVRRNNFVKGLPYLEKAETLKPSENLKLYVRRVRRAAVRQEKVEKEAAP